ncbi:hypothetical protein ES705_39765 [subsurface metagenome]
METTAILLSHRLYIMPFGETTILLFRDQWLQVIDLQNQYYIQVENSILMIKLEVLQAEAKEQAL